VRNVEEDNNGAEDQEGSLDSIHHVAVVVPDVRQAVEWYTRTFNCRVNYEDASWALLDFANIHLAVVLPSQHPAHIALSIPEAEQFGPLTTHREGTRSVYIRDPFGNALELIAQE
jgi:catechol 2,3-dioxygenase-like lactoylglutathione lyase family enzyme